MGKTLVEMTAEIIQSQIGKREMTTDEVTLALKDTFQTLSKLQESELSEKPIDGEQVKPALSPEKSIKRHKVICLECGQEFKMISSKHLMTHGLTMKEYRKKYGFRMRQPLCAKSLSERRSKAGKERGLPQNLKKSIAARKKKK